MTAKISSNSSLGSIQQILIQCIEFCYTRWSKQRLVESLIGTYRRHNESGASRSRRWQPGCAQESEAEFFNFAPGKLALVNKIVSLGSRGSGRQHAYSPRAPRIWQFVLAIKTCIGKTHFIHRTRISVLVMALPTTFPTVHHSVLSKK